MLVVRRLGGTRIRAQTQTTDSLPPRRPTLPSPLWLLSLVIHLAKLSLAKLSLLIQLAKTQTISHKVVLPMRTPRWVRPRLSATPTYLADTCRTCRGLWRSFRHSSSPTEPSFRAPTLYAKPFFNGTHMELSLQRERRVQKVLMCENCPIAMKFLTK